MKYTTKAIYHPFLYFIDFFGHKILKSPNRNKSQLKDINKILVLRLDRIGDVILATPSFYALRNVFPHVHITVMVGSWAKEVLEGNPYIDEIIIFDAPWFDQSKKLITSLSETIELIRVLKSKKFDLAIDLRGDFRNILLMYLGKIRCRIGYGSTGGGFLLTTEIPYAEEPEYQVDRNLDVIRVLGTFPTVKSPFIPTSKKDIDYVNNLLSKLQLSKMNPMICINMFSTGTARMWITDRFAQLADYLQKKFNANIIFIGQASDSNKVRETIELMKTKKKAIDFTGKTSLKQLATLISMCNLLITINSAPLHIAVAVETPTIALFSGTESPHQWAPSDKQYYIIQESVSCSPCHLKECKENICMKKITVEEVLSAVNIFLDGNMKNVDNQE